MNKESEKKVSNQIISNSADFDQAYEDISAFIYTVSHELKTPSREISLYAEFIEEDNRGKLTPQSIEDIHSIRRTCDEMTSMVQRMMEYSKAGFKALESEEIKTSFLVRQCFDEIMCGFPARQIELSIDELPDIYGDRFLFKLLTTNILSNSIKFTREKPSAKIKVFSKMSEKFIEYHFRDNGIGFDMTYSSQIFEAFQRLQNEGTYEGTGIGLATVKKIMTRFGGEVNIFARPGLGCEVTILLPISMLYTSRREPEFDRNIVKIGIIGDFSGMCSYLERCKIAAYKLAAEEINKFGGINGKQVKLLFRDDRSDFELTRLVASELTETEKVDVLMGSSLSPSREVMRSVAEKTKTLFLNTQQTEGGVSSHYTFCLSAMPEQQIALMLEYLIKRYGHKCYIVAADYNYGILSAEWAKHFVRQFGGEVVGTEYLDDKINCFDPIIDRILQVKADILFTILVFPNHDGFYTRWHERGLNHIPNATTMVAAESYQNVEFEPPILENTYFMASFIEELEMPSAQQFVKKYRAKNDRGEVPYMGMDSETVYSAMYLYKCAAEKAGTTETEAVISELESGTVYVDGPGGRVTVRGEDHHTLRSLSCFRLNSEHKAIELFRTEPICSNYVESMIEKTIGVKGGICALGVNTPSTQYNMLLNKFR